MVVQWLRSHASNAGAQVLSLVRELKFHLPLAVAQNKQTDLLSS